MLTCLLCLQKKSDQIKINSKKGKELNCFEIISRHFWFKPKIEKKSTENVCLTCWDVLLAFHELYEAVSKAHNYFECQVSNNSISLEEVVKLESDNLAHLPKIEIHEADSGEENGYTKDELNVKSTTASGDIFDNEDSENEIPLSMLKSNEAQTFEIESTDELHQSLSEEALDCEIQYSSDNGDGFSESDSEMVSDFDPDFDETEDTTTVTKKTRTKLSKNFDEIIKKCFEKLLCFKCKLGFEKYDDLSQHTIGAHNIAPIVICCGRKFKKRQTLSNHVLIHLNPEHLKCPHCQRVFKNDCKLEKHLETDHQCKQCSEVFPSKEKLEQHLLTIHSIKTDCELVCTECNKKFITKRKLRDHKRLVHCVKVEAICDQCGKYLSSSKSLWRHIRDKHTDQPYIKPDPTQCDICGKWLKNRHILRQHQIWQHENRCEQQCPLCEHKAATKRALDNHIHRMHKSKREFPCTMCGKVLKSERELKGHINIHTKEVQHTCELCSKNFNIRASLLKHMKRYHSGKPPKQRLQCEICDAWLISPLFLKKHIEKVHGKQDVKQPCPICGRVSVNEKALRRHIKRNHIPNVREDQSKDAV